MGGGVLASNPGGRGGEVLAGTGVRVLASHRGDGRVLAYHPGGRGWGSIGIPSWEQRVGEYWHTIQGWEVGGVGSLSFHEGYRKYGKLWWYRSYVLRCTAISFTFLCCTGQFMISKDSCIFFNLLGDPVSQQKVFEEMIESKVKPNGHTYSELMKTYIMK